MHIFTFLCCVQCILTNVSLSLTFAFLFHIKIYYIVYKIFQGKSSWIWEVIISHRAGCHDWLLLMLHVSNWKWRVGVLASLLTWKMAPALHISPPSSCFLMVSPPSLSCSSPRYGRYCLQHLVCVLPQFPLCAQSVLQLLSQLSILNFLC